MTRPRSFYDVVVVGGSVGALSAGAMLARRGFRVAWIRHDERPNVYAVDGYTLLRGADAFMALETPSFRRVAAELALAPVMRRRTRPVEPLYQVVLPGHRVDVRTGPDALLAELSREFPEVRRPMDEFYANLTRAMTEMDGLLTADVSWPAVGFFERRRALQVARTCVTVRPGDARDPLGDFPAGHPFRTFVHAQSRFASGLDPDEPGAFRVVRAHGTATRGAAMFDGGRDGLCRLLEEKIVQHGGEVRARDRVSRIAVDRGRVAGVDLSTTDERLGCTFVLATLDLEDVLRLCELRASRAVAERLLSHQPRYSEYVLNVVVAAEGIPAGMSSRVFAVADRARPLAEENLLSIEVRTEPTHAIITVTALLPRSGVDEGEAYLHRQRPRILNALEQVVPFLRRNILLVDSPHDGLPPTRMAGPRGAKEGTLEAEWRPRAEPMRVIEAQEPGAWLGVGGFPCRTEVQGLLLASRQTVPGLGEEGEILAAVTAARIITRSDRTKEKLRRELWSKDGA